MTNEIKELIMDSEFDNQKVKTVYSELQQHQPMAIATEFHSKIDQKVKEFVEDYEDVYKPEVFNQKLNELIEKEVARSNAEIERSDTRIESKVNTLLKIAEDELSKSENISTDEIAKRNYLTENLRNDISIDLLSIDERYKLVVYMSDKLNEARKDTNKAHAFKRNLSLFIEKANGMSETDKGVVLAEIKYVKEELDKVMFGNDSSVYKGIVNSVGLNYSSPNMASKISIDMKVEHLKHKYKL